MDAIEVYPDPEREMSAMSDVKVEPVVVVRQAFQVVQWVVEQSETVGILRNSVPGATMGAVGQDAA